MKIILRVVFLFFALGSILRAEVVVSSGSRMVLNGDSTLHRYSSTTTVFNIEMRLSQNSWLQVLNHSDQNFVLKIPVESFYSGESLLDKKMQSSLKQKEFPQIIFKLDSFRYEKEILYAQGRLQVAGESRSINLSLQTQISENTLEIRGQTKLKMTDFKIDPPKMFLGTLKTSNEVQLDYRLVLQIR